MTNDVARTYLNAPSLSPTFVESYVEDFEEGDEYRCGELRVSTCIRDAPISTKLATVVY